MGRQNTNLTHTHKYMKLANASEGFWTWEQPRKNHTENIRNGK